MADLLVNHPAAQSLIPSQILGHERGTNTTHKVYRKDVDADGHDSPLVRAIELLQFDCLKQVAPFDGEAGIKALSDAMRRKRSGRGVKMQEAP